MIMFNYYIKASMLALIIVFFSYSRMFAQEEANTHSEEKHLIALSLGYTHIPKGGEAHHAEATGVFVPSIGLDYFFRIHQRWEIGVMAELDPRLFSKAGNWDGDWCSNFIPVQTILGKVDAC